MSRDDFGEINFTEMREVPNPAIEIAGRFLDKVPEVADARAEIFAGDSGVAVATSHGGRQGFARVRIRALQVV